MEPARQRAGLNMDMNNREFYTCMACGETFDTKVMHNCRPAMRPPRTKDVHSRTLDAGPEYATLATVLVRAFDQAANGKGKARHASAGVAFEHQPMSTINMEQGSIDGFLYQARKKAIEAKRLPAGRAQAELLGAINYLAGAVIALDTWAADTLPKE